MISMTISRESKYKIAFIHNKLMPYRVGIFKLLSDMYSLSFFFTHESNTENYGLDNCTFLGSKIEDRIFLPKLSLIPILLFGRYDVVICGSWDSPAEIIELCLCLIVSKAKNTPLIIWTESWNHDSSTIMYKRKLASPLIKFVLRNSDVCVGPGIKTKELFLFFGVDPSRIFIAPNAIPLSDANDLKNFKDKFQDIADKKKILYMSRVVPYKGLDILIKAYSRVERERNDVVLLIAGSGNYLQECKILADSLGLKNCIFFGYVADQMKNYLYELADIFVLPSTFRDGICEAWGLVLNEAMGHKKPVISTDAVAGAYDLIDDGENGCIIESGNEDQLYKALLKLLSDPNLINNFGNKSFKIITGDFTIEKMAIGFRDAIECAICNKE